MTEEFKTYINRLIRKCRSEVFASEYAYAVRWHNDPSDNDGNDGIKTYMAIKINTVYLYFTLHVYPESFATWQQGLFSRNAEHALHELCHVLTEPLWEIMREDMKPSQRVPYNDILERQTQRITYAMLNLMPKDWYLPEKLAAEYPDEEVPKETKEEPPHDRNDGNDTHPETQA